MVPCEVSQIKDVIGRLAGLSCSRTLLVLTDLSTHALTLWSNGQRAEPARMVTASPFELSVKQKLFVRRQ